MPKVRAENRLTEKEQSALALGLSLRRKVLGSMSAVAREAGVRQPFISMAANRKLVARTNQITKLFEYLIANDLVVRSQVVSNDGAADIGKMLIRLTDGTEEGANRLRRLLEAIEAFHSVR